VSRQIIIVLQRDHAPSALVERALPQVKRVVPADIEIHVSYEPKVPRCPALLCKVGNRIVYHYAGPITPDKVLEILRELL